MSGMEFKAGRYSVRRVDKAICIYEDGKLLHVARNWTAALEWLDDLKRPGAKSLTLDLALVSEDDE